MEGRAASISPCGAPDARFANRGQRPGRNPPPQPTRPRSRRQVIRKSASVATPSHRNRTCAYGGDLDLQQCQTRSHLGCGHGRLAVTNNSKAAGQGSGPMTRWRSVRWRPARRIAAPAQRPVQSPYGGVDGHRPGTWHADVASKDLKGSSYPEARRPQGLFDNCQVRLSGRRHADPNHCLRQAPAQAARLAACCRPDRVLASFPWCVRIR